MINVLNMNSDDKSLQKKKKIRAKTVNQLVFLKIFYDITITNLIFN